MSKNILINKNFNQLIIKIQSYYLYYRLFNEKNSYYSLSEKEIDFFHLIINWYISINWSKNKNNFSLENKFQQLVYMLIDVEMISLDDPLLKDTYIKLDNFYNADKLKEIKTISYNENEFLNIYKLEELNPDQIKLKEYLMQDNLIKFVSTPTSFGKSHIIRKIIDNIKFNNILFIVPTNALLNEYIIDLNSKFYNKYFIYGSSNVKIKTDAKNIFVLTQEKAIVLLSINKIYFDYIFVDEAQNVINLKEKRAFLLVKLLEYLMQDNLKSLIFLSPNLLNAKKNFFDIWNKKFSQSEIKYFETTKTYTSRNYYIFKKIDNNYDISFYDFYNSEWKIKEQKLYDDKFQIIIELIKNKSNFKNVIYSSKKEMRQIADKISLSNLDNNFNNSDILKFCKFISKNFGENYYLIGYLKKGIALHHGDMNDFVRQQIEYFYNQDNNLLNHLIATSTLAQGVNLNCDRLIMLIQSTNQKKLSVDLYLKNLFGRVGRLSLKPYGDVIAIVDKKDWKSFKDAVANEEVKNIDKISDYIDKLNKIIKRVNEQKNISFDDREYISCISKFASDLSIGDSSLKKEINIFIEKNKDEEYFKNIKEKKCSLSEYFLTQIDSEKLELKIRENGSKILEWIFKIKEWDNLDKIIDYMNDLYKWPDLGAFLNKGNNKFLYPLKIYAYGYFSNMTIKQMTDQRIKNLLKTKEKNTFICHCDDFYSNPFNRVKYKECDMKDSKCHFLDPTNIKQEDVNALVDSTMYTIKKWIEFYFLSFFYNLIFLLIKNKDYLNLEEEELLILDNLLNYNTSDNEDICLLESGVSRLMIQEIKSWVKKYNLTFLYDYDKSKFNILQALEHIKDDDNYIELYFKSLLKK